MMTQTLQLIAGLMFIAVLVVAVIGIRTAANATEYNEHNNVTVIHKTDELWPVKGLMTMKPCDFRACTNV
jgi:hypothetical protein